MGFWIPSKASQRCSPTSPVSTARRLPGRFGFSGLRACGVFGVLAFWRLRFSGVRLEGFRVQSGYSGLERCGFEGCSV